MAARPPTLNRVARHDEVFQVPDNGPSFRSVFGLIAGLIVLINVYILAKSLGVFDKK